MLFRGPIGLGRWDDARVLFILYPKDLSAEYCYTAVFVGGHRNRASVFSYCYVAAAEAS